MSFFPTEAAYQEWLKTRGGSPEVPAAGPPEAASKPERAAAKIRTPRGMNKWEKAYAAEELEPRRLIGEILWYGFEALKVRLADGAVFTPDFAVLFNAAVGDQLENRIPGRTEFHEVKGMWREAARVRIKVAAEVTPYRFVAVTKKSGAWVQEIFGGRIPDAR